MSDTNGLTIEEQATNYQTMRHIERVRNLLDNIAAHLLRRGKDHDQSKLERPEVELFTEHTARLAGMTYGTAEYTAALADLGPALRHHYSRNRHHPEHHKHGIDDMNLVDLVEMLCDWKAASERHNDGNIRTSIEHNADRFSMSPQLVRIFENSVDLVS